MPWRAPLRRFGLRPLAGLLTLMLLAAVPPVAGTTAAQAQSRMTVTVDFRTALEPYGTWEQHPRWGEVWIPDVDRNWRPYTVGRWVHTDEWGWYWVSADEEADWGWIVFHYGRWVFDRDRGWMWTPGTEWSPGWVQWRRGHQHVGWAPLPPDDIVVAYRDQPDVWIFIQARDFDRPRLVDVILPPREVYIEETVVVNQTVVVEDRGPVIAVNPGIPAAIIAAAIGQPIRTYDVRPRILAGTARIRGARVVSAQDLRQRGRIRSADTDVRRTSRVVRPAQQVAEPQPLAAGERGRLGDDPPRAARRAASGRPGVTTGATPARQGADLAIEARERQAGDDRDLRAGEGRRGSSKAPPRAGDDPRDVARERGDDRRNAREDRREAGDERRESREQQQNVQEPRRGGREGRAADREDGGEVRERRRESVARPLPRPELTPRRGRGDRDRTEGRRSAPAQAAPAARGAAERRGRVSGRDNRAGPPHRGPRASAPPRISAPPRPSGPRPAARAPAPSRPAATTGQAPSAPARAAPAPGPKPKAGGPPGRGGPPGHGGGGKGKKH